MRFLWIVKIFWEMAWGRDDGRCVHMSVWGYCEAALPPTPGLCRLVVGPWQGEPALMWFARSSVLATPQGSVLRIKQVLVWFLQPPGSHHGARCSDCQLDWRNYNEGSLEAAWAGNEPFTFQAWLSFRDFIINIPLSCHSSSSSKTNSNLDVPLCKLTSFLKYKAQSNSSYSTAV